MIQRRKGLCLAFEARDAVAVGGREVRQHLDGDIAMELRVARR
jgi:hypothetical protein